MAPQKCNVESGKQNKKVGFKELEPLLRESLKNKDLELVDYTAIKLLPPGENYCSIMVKLDIKYRKNKSSNVEILHLVAKTPSCTERPIVEWSLVFKKELFMYAELHPLYRQLERDVGIQETELIDVWPEYIGYRNSLKNNNIADEDSALLMKNIKAEGYYNCNRIRGLDIHHSRIALTSLAKYHALGIAMKQKRPEFAKKAADQACILGIDFPKLDEGFNSLRRTFAENSQLHKHLSIIESSFDRVFEGGPWIMEPTEPWAAITHGDFWTNNILFHKDDEGNVDDVKFVDFQTYLYSSPLKDIPYFLCGSLDKETQTNYLEELVVLYYDTFIQHLRRLNYDPLLFTKESFSIELKNQAITEFPLCALSIKFFEHENNDDNISNEDLMNDILNLKSSHSFIEGLKDLVEIYEKMGWFENC